MAAAAALSPAHTALGAALLLALAAIVNGQRITTIQLDGTQYFVSRMNPYSPELNYFLAYQYCRSLGLQLASFESREKADSLMQYLRNAGYNKFDYWTSGNRLGTDMLLWMSTGSPFNTTFDYMRRSQLEGEAAEGEAEGAPNAAPGVAQPPPPPPLAPVAAAAAPARAGLGRARSRRPGRQSAEEVSTGCVALKAPALDWDTDDCLQLKDFICEQTRCYYYNYGSIPVSTSQGDKRHRPPTYTAPPPSSTTHSPLYVGGGSDHSTAATHNHTQAQESVFRRVTLRPPPPVAAAVTTTTESPPDAVTATDAAAATEAPSDDDGGDEVQDESVNFASRSFPEKDAVANVVYVTAVGAEALNASSTETPTTAAAAAAAASTPAAATPTPTPPPRLLPGVAVAAAVAAAPERPITFSRGRIDPVSLDAALLADALGD